MDIRDLSVTPKTCQAYPRVVWNVSARYTVCELYNLKLRKTDFFCCRGGGVDPSSKILSHFFGFEKNVLCRSPRRGRGGQGYLDNVQIRADFLSGWLP